MLTEDTQSLVERLQDSGLRPTRQRLALASLLFDGHHKHITAEALHEAALRRGEKLSLATVYNTLNQFTKAGLLRDIAVDGAKTFFDTNTHDHHHFFDEDDQSLMDCPAGTVHISRLPEAPEGMTLSRIDVVVRVRKC